MGKHVAVKQPVAGIMRRKRDLARLAPECENGIPERSLGAVCRDLAEVHAVEVHGMRKGGVIDDFKTDRLIVCQSGQWVIRHTDDVIEGPELVGIYQLAKGSPLSVELGRLQAAHRAPTHVKAHMPGL